MASLVSAVCVAMEDRTAKIQALQAGLVQAFEALSAGERMS